MLDVKVVTSEKLTKELSEKVERVFRKMLAPEEPRFEYAVDESILGGIRVTCGETVYDGTVATQLEKLKRNLL